MTSSSIADTGIKFVDIVGKMANIALKVDQTGLGIANVLGPLANFIPYYSQAVAVLQIAQPILSKISAAAPAVSGVIDAGRPIIEAVQESAPSIFPHLKDLLAIAINHDPTFPTTGMTADQISDGQALAFAGPVFLGHAWSKEETQRWWDKAQGVA